jgi:hypothetical protein
MQPPPTPIGRSLINNAVDLGTVLGIWAHPDDEAFRSAGPMAAARDAGQRVVCVTATLGEHGTDDPQRWPPQRLARVRTHEARASLAALGVTEHHLLGVSDGTCAAQPPDSVVRRLAQIIQSVDTILTFGPDGMSGHEDPRRCRPGPPQPAPPPLRTPGCSTRPPPRSSSTAGSLRGRCSTCSSLTGCRCAPRRGRWPWSCASTRRWSSETFVAADTARSRMQEWEWGTWRAAA